MSAIWFRKQVVLLLISASSAIGCYSTGAKTAGEYFSSPEYQGRETLRESLFRGDLAVLSNDEISTILDSKIELPRQAHVAVLHLGDPMLGLSWSLAPSEEGAGRHAMARLAESSRVTRVSPLPSLLIPERLRVPHLREAAARFQADLLIIYRTPCRSFSEYRWIGRDESKTYCVAEAVLLDVRTGIIPFSTFASRAIEAEKSQGDVNLYEASKRAEQTAIDETLKLVAAEVVSFLDSVP